MTQPTTRRRQHTSSHVNKHTHHTSFIHFSISSASVSRVAWAVVWQVCLCVVCCCCGVVDCRRCVVVYSVGVRCVVEADGIVLVVVVVVPCIHSERFRMCRRTARVSHDTRAFLAAHMEAFWMYTRERSFWVRTERNETHKTHKTHAQPNSNTHTHTTHNTQQHTTTHNHTHDLG